MSPVSWQTRKVVSFFFLLLAIPDRSSSGGTLAGKIWEAYYADRFGVWLAQFEGKLRQKLFLELLARELLLKSYSSVGRTLVETLVFQPLEQSVHPANSLGNWLKTSDWGNAAETALSAGRYVFSPATIASRWIGGSFASSRDIAEADSAYRCSNHVNCLD